MLSPYLGVCEKQIARIGIVMRPNALEAKRMLTYEFMEQELPKNGEHLRGVFFEGRRLNLKAYKPDGMEDEQA